MNLGKQRKLKTLYERFSHHKVNDLPGLEEEIKNKLISDYEQWEIDIKRGRTDKDWSPFEAIDRLNIQYSGKFYVSGECSDKGYSDAYCFRDIWEKIVLEKPFKTTNENFIEVRVLGSDYKDAVLVVYKSYRQSDGRFYTHILRDKHSDILLEGNIAKIV